MTLLFVLSVRRHRKTSNSEAFIVRQVLRTSYQIFALCKRQVRMASGDRYSPAHFCTAFSQTPSPLAYFERAQELASCAIGAGDGTRTRDSLLGRQELYH